MRILHNASKSCRNFTAVQLWQKYFYSIDPKGEVSLNGWSPAGMDWIPHNMKIRCEATVS